ncbi:MAG TPA: tyrosine-type recombinase/integrase, partial [Trueperaceae bacterium]|nr:tyrosine-type recombinase/integrase [Trueperaceae bacterium]
ADGQRMTAHPKTSKSRRALPMFDLRDPLLAHRAWQAERGLDAGGYVFTNQDGGMLAPWAFNKRELLRIGTAASIGFPVTLYTFRHTFATVHLQLGTPLKVVSDWLGHSTILQTANTYQHVSDEIATDYAERYLQRLAQATQADGKTAPN